MGTGADLDVSPALLETLFSSGPVGYAFVDSSLRFVIVNERLAAITACLPKRTVAAPWRGYLSIC